MAKQFKTRDGDFLTELVALADYLGEHFGLSFEELDEVIYEKHDGETMEDILLRLAGDPNYGSHN